MQISVLGSLRSYRPMQSRWCILHSFPETLRGTNRVTVETFIIYAGDGGAIRPNPRSFDAGRYLGHIDSTVPDNTFQDLKQRMLSAVVWVEIAHNCMSSGRLDVGCIAYRLPVTQDVAGGQRRLVG